MTYQHILYDVSEKIATITLNRPDRMNAWTPIMERDVRHAMEAASRGRRCARHRADRCGARVLRRRRHGRAEGARSRRYQARREPAAVRHEPPARLADALCVLSVDPQAGHRHAERRHRRHRPGARAVLRSALCRRQHGVHHRVLAPRADRRAWHQLDAAAHRRSCQCARSADVGAPGLTATRRCASGSSTGCIRRISCASRPMPMRAIWPISSRRARSP